MSSESHQSNTPDPRAQRRPDTPRPDARPQVATPNIFPTLREHNGYNAQVFGEAIDNAITSQNEAATSCSLESRIEPMHAIGTPAWDSLPQQNNEAPSIFSPCANNSLMEPNPFIGTNIQAALPRLGFSSDYTMAAAIDTPVVMGPPTRVPIPTHEIDPNDVNHYDTADDVAGLGQIPHYECSRYDFPYGNDSFVLISNFVDVAFLGGLHRMSDCISSWAP